MEERRMAERRRGRPRVRHETDVRLDVYVTAAAFDALYLIAKQRDSNVRAAARRILHAGIVAVTKAATPQSS